MNSGARRLEPISSSQCEASIAPIATGKNHEALFTSRSSAPNASSAADTSARGAIGASSSALTVALFGARRVQLRLQLRRRRLGAAVVQHDVRARGMQPARDRRADAARAAGHQCRFALSDASMEAGNSRVNSAMLAASGAEIAAHGGWISFARYMELALHAPGLGYYAGGARKFGAARRLRHRAGARQPVRPHARAPAARAPAHPRDRRGQRRARRSAAERARLRLLLLETSADLRDRQRERLGERVRLLDSLPARFRGAVVANEVVDAMPVHAVAWRDAGVFERGVPFRRQFRWDETRPASGAPRDAARN